MPLTKSTADELANTVKQRFPHLYPAPSHEPIERYPDRHLVYVYGSEPTGDKLQDYGIPHFILFDANDLQQHEVISLLLYPDLNKPPLIDETHMKWLAALLDPDATLMEAGQGAYKECEETVLYLRPSTYGERRYHMLTLGYTYGLILEQTDHGEKYAQRIALEQEEYAPLLAQLLIWWLNKVKPNLEEMAKADSIEETL